MAAAHSLEKDWGNRRREAFVGFVREVLTMENNALP